MTARKVRRVVRKAPKTHTVGHDHGKGKGRPIAPRRYPHIETRKEAAVRYNEDLIQHKENVDRAPFIYNFQPTVQQISHQPGIAPNPSFEKKEATTMLIPNWGPNFYQSSVQPESDTWAPEGAVERSLLDRLVGRIKPKQTHVPAPRGKGSFSLEKLREKELKRLQQAAWDRELSDDSWYNAWQGTGRA